MTTEIERLKTTMQGYQRAITQAEDALNTLHQCYSRDKRILLILQIRDHCNLPNQTEDQADYLIERMAAFLQSNGDDFEDFKAEDDDAFADWLSVMYAKDYEAANKEMKFFETHGYPTY